MKYLLCGRKIVKISPVDPEIIGHQVIIKKLHVAQAECTARSASV